MQQARRLLACQALRQEGLGAQASCRNVTELTLDSGRAKASIHKSRVPKIGTGHCTDLPDCAQQDPTLTWRQTVPPAEMLAFTFGIAAAQNAVRRDCQVLRAA